MANLTTEWDNDDKTIMRVTYHAGWSWDDLEANLIIEAQMLDSVDHKVDVIADFRGTQLPPGAISRLPKIAQSPPYTHPNSGAMVMVGSPAFMKEVVGVYKRVYGQAAKLTMVHDLDEARVIILQKREEATRKTQETAAVKDAEQKSEESTAAQATEQKSEESAAAKDTGPKSEEPAVKGAEPKSEKKPDADQKTGQGNPPQ
jgi:hypothetical protein